jgi:hypothetical protein
LKTLRFVISEPAFFAGEESAVGGQEPDPSRHKTALRNDKLFNLHDYLRVSL